LQYLIAENL